MNLNMNFNNARENTVSISILGKGSQQQAFVVTTPDHHVHSMYA